MAVADDELKKIFIISKQLQLYLSRAQNPNKTMSVIHGGTYEQPHKVAESIIAEIQRIEYRMHECDETQQNAWCNAMAFRVDQYNMLKSGEGVPPPHVPFSLTEEGSRDGTLRLYDKKCGAVGIVVHDVCAALQPFQKETYAQSIRDEICRIQNNLYLKEALGDSPAVMAPWMHAMSLRKQQLALLDLPHNTMHDPYRVQVQDVLMTGTGGQDALLQQYDKYYGIRGVVTY